VAAGRLPGLPQVRSMRRCPLRFSRNLHASSIASTSAMLFSFRIRLLAMSALATLIPCVSTLAQSGTDLKSLELQFGKARDSYLEILSSRLPAAYKEHFAQLSDEDLAVVAKTKRLWQWYIAEGPLTMGDPRKQSTGIFRAEFLDPINRVAQILLIDPQELDDIELLRARNKAFDLGQRLRDARESAGVDIDPTKNKKSPTGIQYPHLDKPHTCIDLLELYERTLVLAKTVAHPAAEPVLMQNAQACAEIDMLEADFVMYGNQVRMLSGSIAWVCDPLMTACTRDHSDDRVNGRASGHQSQIEGKRFPGDRARRFGCRGGPEGAGGGSTGEGAVRGYSYNGTGHGGPMFARLRNVVAPGNRNGAVTSVYNTDNSLKHACQATEGELYLPPGVLAASINQGNKTIFRAIADGKFKKAYVKLQAPKPKDSFDATVRRYLAARLDAEIDWTLTGIERILDTGDVYEAHRRFVQAKRAMRGIPAFDQRIETVELWLALDHVKDEIRAGEAYQKIISTGKADRRQLERFAEKNKNSEYAAAARHCMQAGNNAFWPELFYFVMKDAHLNKWSYLHHDRVAR